MTARFFRNQQNTRGHTRFEQIRFQPPRISRVAAKESFAATRLIRSSTTRPRPSAVAKVLRRYAAEPVFYVRHIDPTNRVPFCPSFTHFRLKRSSAGGDDGFHGSIIGNFMYRRVCRLGAGASSRSICAGLFERAEAGAAGRGA